MGNSRNFTPLDNAGSIVNDKFLVGGVGRGIFNNRSTLNNLAGGDAVNRHRWFNRSFSELNNEGLFTNEAGGLGLSNEAGAAIHNLGSGVFVNQQVINNAGEITNAGSFRLDGLAGGDIAGEGNYIQTAGETIVDATLHASTIEFQGGVLRGQGTLAGQRQVRGKPTTCCGSISGETTTSWEKT